MASRKSAIIEDLFRSVFDASTQRLTRSMVTLQDVSDAIERHNKGGATPLSTRNPANFFKDIVRKRKSANANWPKFVLQSGYTARQATGQGLCFEFVRMLPGQTEPFPADPKLAPDSQTPVFSCESVSMPIAARRLGRRDEPWLIQVVANLRIVQSHFALASQRQVLQLDLLQMNVKLNRTEIDALFLAHEKGGKETIVTCEAKGLGEDILLDQIRRQAMAPFTMKGITQDTVVPIAIKIVGSSEVLVVEFDAVERSTYRQLDQVSVASKSVFRIVPPVPGIKS